MFTGLSLLLVLSWSARGAMAQEATPQLLDGMEIEYTYSEVAHAFQRVKWERISYRSSCARKRMPLWSIGQTIGTRFPARGFNTGIRGILPEYISWGWGALAPF
jgi:hypothetical protein